MSGMKPCPFCGGKNVLSTELQDGLPFIAYCQCGAENEAENWNTRPIEDALNARIAELEALVEGHDPFEDFPPKERGFDCSVMVLGKFEYEDEFTPFTNWDLCVYWFDEERWHPLNGYVKGDDIVRWYALPYKEREE